jgi:hypothetical protein
MCQNSTVQKVVDGLVSKGFMFTAWDVTKLARKVDPSLRHYAVNDDVQSMFRNNEMPDYEHDTKDVGAKVKPFVYYHHNGDINLYQADWVENNPTQKGMLNDAPASSVAGIAQPTPSTLGNPLTSTVTAMASAFTAPVVKAPKGTVSPNKEGRLNISPVVTMQCGFNIKQTVWVEKENGKLVITPKMTSAAYPITVNSDGRLRVCRTLLKQISQTATYFKVKPSHNLMVANSARIEIEAA